MDSIRWYVFWLKKVKKEGINIRIGQLIIGQLIIGKFNIYKQVQFFFFKTRKLEDFANTCYQMTDLK